MGRVLPILFNTDMVLAILDGRKTVTRRVVRYKYSNTEMKMRTDKYGTRLIEIQKDIEGETHGRNPDGGTWHKLLPYIEKKPPYQPGDILYIRETWAFLPCVECMDEGPSCHIEPVVYDDGDCESEGCFVYKASHPRPERVSWTPSIHMPKKAARIWLRVTNVRAERLQDMNGQDILMEGVNCHVHPEADYFEGNQKMMFEELWNSTIKKDDLESYGWDANPWVWVIGFERCEKPKEL
ncbi:MAG: hypothetical protein HFI56_08285 [Lachnospiraceae bacterium]|nr:hypothetical protein [Lachnospiraceae bacterium]